MFMYIVYLVLVEKMFVECFCLDAWVVKFVYGMNEIYVVSFYYNNNFDMVFYMEYIDGLWVVYLFCFLYCCMFVVNENVKVEIIFI